MKELEVRTTAGEELVDITARIEQEVAASGVRSGLCVVYVPHTTAGVTVNENADPDVRRDILLAVKKIVPDTWHYQHSEGNSPAHVKSSLAGHSVALIIEAGRLQLGTWQGVYFCEFDGPRTRKVYLKILPSQEK